MSAPPTRPLLRLDPNLRHQCRDRTARKIVFQMMTTPAVEKSNISNMLRGFIAAERARTREGGTPLRIKVDLAYDLSSGLFRWMRTFEKAGQHTLPVEMWAEHEPMKEQGMRWRLMRSYCAAEAARAAANVSTLPFTHRFFLLTLTQTRRYFSSSTDVRLRSATFSPFQF
ncbi:hypothetical protein FIBSPDRAFT_593747 [Athelia psychrophila]|uniref:Uncharacterized protein n=1 Tax=Athelia psychrophila TaxID=1759441 RepID=A0A167T730_9AGAM|nr:hypothetical protein FIBSPDRAFT_593747 [Fibularhizoctonia sp. CBS 109695]